MNALHRLLIRHEAGHAVAGLLAGADVVEVAAPPLPDMDVPPDDPHAAVGYCALRKRTSPRAQAIGLLGGMLIDGGRAPAWPIVPGTADERPAGGAGQR